MQLCTHKTLPLEQHVVQAKKRDKKGFFTMRLNRAALELLLTSKSGLLQSQKHNKNGDGDKSQPPFRFWEREIKKKKKKSKTTWRTQKARRDLCRAQDSSPQTNAVTPKLVNLPPPPRDQVSQGDVLSCLKKLLQHLVDPSTASQHTHLQE